MSCHYIEDSKNQPSRPSRIVTSIEVVYCDLQMVSWFMIHQAEACTVGFSFYFLKTAS